MESVGWDFVMLELDTIGLCDTSLSMLGHACVRLGSRGVWPFCVYALGV